MSFLIFCELIFVHERNSEMKHKAIFIFTVALALAHHIHAQDANTTTECKPKPESKFLVGGGFSSFHLIGGYGGHLKAEYRLGKKLTAGVKGILTNEIWQDYEMPADGLISGIKVDYSGGRAYTLNLQASYYIFGNNQPSGKGGIYASGGFGYTVASMKSNAEATLPVADPGYYKFRSDFGSKNFSCMLALGFDRKFKKGRFYAEVLYSYAIQGSDYHTFSYEKEPSSGKNPDLRFNGYREFEPFPFVNIGYQFYLFGKKSAEDVTGQDIQECPVKIN